MSPAVVSVDGFKAGDHVVSCFFPFWENGPPAIGDFTTTPGDGVDGYAREVVVLPSQYFTHAPTASTTPAPSAIGMRPASAGSTPLTTP